MLKFSHRAKEPGQKHLVALGVEEGNLRLLEMGKPIAVQGTAFTVPNCPDYVLSFCHDVVDLQRQMQPLCEKMYGVEGDRTVKVGGVNVRDGELIAVFLPRPDDGRHIHFVGLTKKTFAKLRTDKRINYTFSREGDTPVETMLFFVDDRAKMEQEFISEGLIGPGTLFTIDGERQFVSDIGHFRAGGSG